MKWKENSRAAPLKKIYSIVINNIVYITQQTNYKTFLSHYVYLDENIN